MKSNLSSIFLAILLAAVAVNANLANADAPGAPGIPHRWAPARKQALGTAYEAGKAQSPVWFTVAEGILTEVFYPTADRAQVGDFQFIVTDGEHFFSEQKRDTVSTVQFVDEGMTVHIQGTDRAGRYKFEQEMVTDSAAPVVRIHTTFHWLQKPLRVFLLFKPALNNLGSNNLGSVNASGLYASSHAPNGNADAPQIFANVQVSTPFVATSAGYVGFSDGWQDLSKNFYLTQNSKTAGPGNVALTGEIAVSAGMDFTYDTALSFGSTSSEATTYGRTSLAVAFSKVRTNYETGWKRYVAELTNSSLNRHSRFFAESTFVRRSAQLIKMHEDKSVPGAIVASLSKPAIPDSDKAGEGGGGYHLIWPRDLYHAAMGLLAAGDLHTPLNVLRYYVHRQKSDGSWAQNTWVNGEAYWAGLQMDEVAFPILLAAQLKDRGITSLKSDELEMVRRATTFIMSHGPTTQEDRWEEIGGYVPSTLAAEIAGLRAATSLTGDPAPARVADQWQSMLETWTLVHQGTFGSDYYLRVSPNGEPNSPYNIGIANGGPQANAQDILDGGFLELVRLGVRAPNDPRIQNTLRIYEAPETGIADGTSMIFRRYNHDAYGVNHVGGFWPILAGERGHFAVAEKDFERAKSELHLLEQSASSTGLIPEQTSGMGVASPLVWAHAEEILLHRSIEEGSVFDGPRPSRSR